MIVRPLSAPRRFLTAFTRASSSSSRSAPPAEITAWLNDITSRSPEVVTERLDRRRCVQLEQTLPSRVGVPGTNQVPLLTSAAPDGGQADLPKGHHLVYFQPTSRLDELGKDGSSTEYNAPAPFSRRMWAGGSFTFNPSRNHALVLDSDVTQKTNVNSVDFKNNMIFVNQQRDLYRAEVANDDSSWAVKEVRTHVFRSAEGVKANEAIKSKAAGPSFTVTSPATESTHPSAKAKLEPLLPLAPYTFTYTPTAPLLFRFSALTWNGHRIHYDRDWTRDVEGHPDLVVHGPLTALLLVELAQHVANKAGKQLHKFEYRATSPMYVDKPTRLACGQVEADTAEMGAEQDGRVGMRATATFV